MTARNARKPTSPAAARKRGTAKGTARAGPAPGYDPSVVTSLDAFRRILRALRLAARETLATSGLSAAQLFVLTALAEDDEASMSQLAERTMTDRSSVAAVVDRLVERKLAHRRTSVHDRRRAAVSISAKGRALLAKAPAAPTVHLMTGLRDLPPSRRRRLAMDLRLLTKAMGIDTGSAGMLFEDAVPRKDGKRQ